MALVMKTQNKSRMEENLDLEFIIAEEDMSEIMMVLTMLIKELLEIFMTLIRHR